MPICLVVLLLSHRYIPETRNEHPSRIDWQGSGFLAVILCCLLFPLALGPSLHWPWQMQLALLVTIPLALLMRQGAVRQQLRGQQPLLPPRLLKLPTVRFSLLIALLFFTCWSGFMFCMALTLQAGAGLGPMQSGNSFIILGISYFLAALVAPKLIRRHSIVPVLLGGIAVQVIAILVLIVTLHWCGNNLTGLDIAPGTLLMGCGQAIIVNSFYRIGMREIQTSDAGAGSAILSTLQQAMLGLGPAAAGAIYLHLHHNNHGNYALAMSGFLVAEMLMMFLLAAATMYNRKLLHETEHVPEAVVVPAD